MHASGVELMGPAALTGAGVAELTLTNFGESRDVYRLSLETDFYQRASADPATVALEPGGSHRVTVASSAPVVVHVYSESRGDEVTSVYLNR